MAKTIKKSRPAAIQQYYNAHQNQFGTPETRNMRLVLTKTAAQANAAKRALQSGGAGARWRKQYSIDPTTRTTAGC